MSEAEWVERYRGIDIMINRYHHGTYQFHFNHEGKRSIDFSFLADARTIVDKVLDDKAAEVP